MVFFDMSMTNSSLDRYVTVSTIPITISLVNNNNKFLDNVNKVLFNLTVFTKVVDGVETES